MNVSQRIVSNANAALLNDRRARNQKCGNRLFHYLIIILFSSVTVFRFLLLVNSISVGGILTAIPKCRQRLLVTNRLQPIFPLIL